MSVKKEKIELLKYLNSLFRCNYWHIKRLRKATRNEGYPFNTNMLYEVSFNGFSLLRAFHSDIETRNCFLEPEFIYERLHIHNLIKIKCQLKMK